MNHRRSTSESTQRRTLRLRNLGLRNLATGVALGAAVVGLSSQSAAQAFPFPSSNIPAANGTTTTVLTSHEIENLYQFWKTSFLETCGNAIRVRYPETQFDTRSEGIGYGMVIAAYMGDQATFNGLRNFYNRFLQNGLMRWRTTNCNDAFDNGSAADADIDAAFGLIVADKQWPGQGYGGQATTLLTAIQNELFLGQCPGILLAGSDFAACNCTNPSYSAPGYYRAFATAPYGNAQFWNQSIGQTYTYLAASQTDSTGLVPAWSQSGGGPVNGGACTPQVSGGGSPNQFQADAARTPWRVATDLLWSGNAQARAFLTPMANFISGGQNRIVQIVDNYALNGTPQTTNGAGGLNAATLDATGRRSTFTMGGFATAMAASNQANLDRFTAAWQSMYLPGDSVDGLHAFNTSLALLYGLTVTGFMWNPVGPAPTPRPEPALNPQAGNLLDNGDFDEGILGWTTENFGAGASEGFAMHKGGELTFEIQENEAAAPWNLPFYQTVSVQQGQKYLISFRARASAARQLRVTVAQVLTPFTTYGEVFDRVNEEQLIPGVPGSGVPLTTEMQLFETVFTSTGTDPAARFAIQLGQSNASVTIDDVIFSLTDRPVSFRGELGEGGGEPVGGQGGAGGAGPGPGGPGTAGTTGAAPIGSIPGEQNPGAGANAPVGAPVGAPSVPGSAPAASGGAPRNAQNCLPYEYSPVLMLCFDKITGYVFNDRTNAWEQPPVTDACRPYVYWPKINGCYDPDTGYACAPNNCDSPDDWQYYGTDYTIDSGSESSSCSLLSAPTSQHGAVWALLGIAASGALVAGRRRVRARSRG